LLRGIIGFSHVGQATGKAFHDDWIFDITVRSGKVARIREYIDTQALADASRTDKPGMA
jgi:uncharacterized protein